VGFDHFDEQGTKAKTAFHSSSRESPHTIILL
jgi:hypothetical protein